MKTRDIKAVLRQRLAEGGHGLPINWPNENGSAARPRLEAEFSGLAQVGEALAGARKVDRRTGTLNIALVVAEGDGTGGADDLADSIADRFTEGHRYPILGGAVVVTRSEVRDGLDANGEWRVPILVRFTAEA